MRLKRRELKKINLQLFLLFLIASSIQDDAGPVPILEGRFNRGFYESVEFPGKNENEDDEEDWLHSHSSMRLLLESVIHSEWDPDAYVKDFTEDKIILQTTESDADGKPVRYRRDPLSNQS